MASVKQKQRADDLMDALAHDRRRRLLFDLLERDTRDDPPVSIVGPPDEDAVGHLVSMKHRHLPKLRAYGFVEWDEPAQVVTAGPLFQEIKPVLESLATAEEGLPVDFR